MEQEYYEKNIENWANSIIELEESHSHLENDADEKIFQDKAALVSLGMPTYYRSRAFSSAIGINNLINAADPLLTLVTKLRKITIPPEVTVLHQNLCHELKAFENKAQTLGYRSQLILAARFIICALFDDLIAVIWPDMQWRKYSLVETFHREMTWDDDRFFLILERSLQDSSGHIDLLELLYVCLRFGYEGKYRGIERGHLELRNITDHLYSIITAHRDEFSRGLLISLENPNYLLVKKKNYSHLLPQAWVVSSVMVLSLVVVFTFCYSKLMEVSSPITQLLNTLKPAPEFAEKISP